GFRRFDTGAALVRVVDVERRPYEGWVYSLEVPEAGTFVTTGGLVVHNCFPKDTNALKQLASNSGYHFQLLSAVIEVNELQKRRVINKLQKYLGRLRGKRIALLGLAFKADTDDMREAPPLVPVAGRPLAAWQIGLLGRAGVDRVILSCNAGAGAQFASALNGVGPELAIAEEPERLGRGGGIRFAAAGRREDGDVLALNGDELLD